MKDYRIDEIAKEDLNIQEYNSFPEKRLFTTLDWLSFVEEDSHATPFFLRITSSGEFVGYFTGMTVRKFGIKIAGSPFSGWSTCYMGFDVIPGVNRLELIPVVKEYLFKKKKALLIEIVDRNISVKEARAAGYTVGVSDTLELDINRTDEDLFKVFKTDCRNFIRQFERRGAILERAIPNDKFAEQYYEQLKDVFAKQGLVPTYSLDKVKCLMRHLSDGENVLCLRVLDPDGNCIATSIYLGYNKTFFFWGGASYRSGQHYRPNEYSIWTAIRFWRDKGYENFDMVGVRDYKKKFGSHEVTYAHITIARFSLIIKLRDLAKKAYFKGLEVKGRLLRRE